MKISNLFVLVFAVAAVFFACSSSRTSLVPIQGTLRGSLLESMESFLRQDLAPAEGTLPTESDSTEYLYGLADLNGDGVGEVVVFVMGKGWCGSGGCRMFVLQQSGQTFRKVAATTVTRTPIRVLESESNGWKDLSVRVAGGGIVPGYDARLSFNGNTYPSNPTLSTIPKVIDPSTGFVVVPGPAIVGEGRLLFAP
jgi:hypothetical protein